MGNNCTSLETIAGNEYLRRLSSSESLSENDPFWNALLAFSLVDLDLVVMSSSNSRLLEDTVSSLCKNLAINNVKTGNFHTQIVYLVRRMDEVIIHGVPEIEGTLNPFIWQVLNSLFIIRNICKYFIQHLSEEVIIQQFLKPRMAGASAGVAGASAVVAGGAGADNTISLFIDALTKGLTQLPVHETTILLHLEMVNTLLTILGMAMYESSQGATNNVFYIEMMEALPTERSVTLTKYLLFVYSHHDSLPSFVYKEERNSLSSTLWSVMTLGMGGAFNATDVKQVNLGVQSLLLLLVLTNHFCSGNPYSLTLSSLLEDEKQSIVKPELLYEALCQDLRNEHAVLLLYKLLHENQVIKAFMLSRTDIEKLVEPLLMVLYEQDGDTCSNHIYLTLITLLILTEDDAFNKDMFRIQLLSVKWYKDKYLSDVTLGDVFILVTLRVMHYNMAHTKDKYLHTNCLAMLANMSSKFVNLHPYVCQKLVAFFTTLAKRHAKTLEKLQIVALRSEDDTENDSGVNSSLHLTTDLSELQEMIRMLFEVINSCIAHTVHLNVNLVHVMLCHRDEFEKFREMEQFKHILQNVHMLLEQFHIKLEKEFGEQPRSVSQVLEVIEKGLKTFRRGTFLKFPDLKFKYIEETDSSRFFVPYVWQVVCRESNLHFKLSKLSFGSS